MSLPRIMPGALALAASLTLIGTAFAAPGCAVPLPPDASARPSKPPAPVKSACVDAKPGTPGCIGFEAYSYNDAVKAYNAQVPAFKAAADAYVAKLNDYVRASSAYAQCEVKALQ